MPRPMTKPEREAFLAAQHVAVLSVASDDARPPHTIPVWYGYEPGGNITCFTGTRSRKARLIERAGVVSLCVQREEPPYQAVTVEGTVVQTSRPPSVDQMLAIVRRYLPEEQAQGFVQTTLTGPGDTMVLFTIRPDRWLTSDFSDDTG